MDVVLQTCLTISIYAAILTITAWTAGALYYDVGRASRGAWVLVLVWVAAVVAACAVWQPAWKALLPVATVFGLFLVWWFSQKPSNQRNWQPSAAVLPRVAIRGDTVTIENVRNTQYQTLEDYTPRYDTRTYRLSQLRGVDVLICFWGSPWMSHPIFVFDFGPDGRVCISIEVRYRIGQEYNLMRSLYRQQELIYIVCDERDAILRRTKYAEGQDVFLYRIVADEDEIRPFFAGYCEGINALIDSPRWYHGVTDNCTTSIYAQRKRRTAWDWRLLFNGRLDQMLHDRERLDQSQSLETLKQQSRVNDIANRAPCEGFGDYIRFHLSGYREGDSGEYFRCETNERVRPWK
jgi:hypothetical protein